MVVKYAKKFPYAPYLNEDIGFEMSIGDNENPLEALAKLKAIAEQFHKENNPQIYLDAEVWQSATNEPLPNNIPIVQQPAALNPLVKKTKEEGYIFLIENAKTMDELKSYTLLSKNYPSIQTAYDKKLKELNK